MVTAAPLKTARRLYVVQVPTNGSRCHVDRPGLARNDCPTMPSPRRRSISLPRDRQPGRAGRSSTATRSSWWTATATSAPRPATRRAVPQRHPLSVASRTAGERPAAAAARLQPPRRQHLASVDLTNPDIYVDGRIVLPKDRCISRARSSSGGAGRTSGWRSAITASQHQPFAHLLFDSDFADLFEVRGIHRARRGSAGPMVIGADAHYCPIVGLDGAFARHHSHLRSAARRVQRRQGRLHLELRRARSARFS